MRVSRSIGYALIAMSYIARNKDQKVILSQDIAKKYDIPLEYLLKILQLLVKANILKSKRGPHGGFTLSKSPQNISILQIVEAIDGPMIFLSNLAEQTPGEKTGAQADKILKKAMEQTRSVFEKTKLSALVAK
jgi:Rrf2 family protein